jgi:HAMP domain-containing protein
VTLRTRLLLGYGYVVGLLLLTAGMAALGLQRFGGGLERVLSENVTSVRAAMAMLDALERQSSATFGALLGDATATRLLATADADFDAALDEAARHAFMSGEDALVASIGQGARELRAARAGLIRAAPDAKLAAYERDVSKRVDAVKAGVNQLLARNVDAMHDADRRARDEARGFAVGLGALVVVALLSLGFLSRALQSSVLARLSELKELGDAIAAGDRARRFRERRDDELGQLARHLNVALDRQEALQGQMEGRFNHQNLLLLGLLARVGEAAVVALDGDVIATTLSSRDEARLLAAAERVRALRSAAKPGPEPVVRMLPATDGNDRLRVELLVAGKTRPAGWLVTFEASPAPMSASPTT